MNIGEQIQEGQNRANEVISLVKKHLEELKKLQIAKSTFQEEVQSEILVLMND